MRGKSPGGGGKDQSSVQHERRGGTVAKAAAIGEARGGTSVGRTARMSSGLLILLAIVVAIVLLAIGVYNGLVSGRQQVRNAWSQIDVQLKRRHDLIPNLVNSVKGAMDFEKSTLTAVTEARNRAVAAKSPQEAMQAENALSGALGRFMAVAEAYPQLRSQEGVSALMEELTATENKLAFARQHYNDAVQAQNVRVAAFPGVFFARMFGFSSETMFEVPATERAAVEAVPQVKL